MNDAEEFARQIVTEHSWRGRGRTLWVDLDAVDAALYLERIGALIKTSDTEPDVGRPETRCWRWSDE